MTDPETPRPPAGRVVLSGMMFGVLTVVGDRYGLHHGWAGSIAGGVFGGLLWTAMMLWVDRYRTRHGKSSVFPPGRFSDNMRAGWAVGRYSPQKWLGLALCFAAFAVLGVSLLVFGSGSQVISIACTVLFGLSTVVSVTQATRAVAIGRRRKHGTTSTQYS